MLRSELGVHNVVLPKLAAGLKRCQGVAGGRVGREGEREAGKGGQGGAVQFDWLSRCMG